MNAALRRVRLGPYDPGVSISLNASDASLGADDVEVWLARADFGVDAAAYSGCYALLDAGERERAARYRFDRDRVPYVLAHALARRVLALHGGVEPDGWSFEIGEHGRPEVSRAFGTSLRFNISHTLGLVACAVTRRRDVGVDVEADVGDMAPEDVAHRYFSPREVADLMALPREDRKARFLTYWVLKESYIKARGLGLALPLDGFSFVLDGEGPIRVEFDERLRDDPARWQFVHDWATPGHSFAVGAARGEQPLAVRVHWAEVTG